MNVDSSAFLQVDPFLPGQWWLTASHHGRMLPEWVDLLAGCAQERYPGKVAILDAANTLISNLRTWENVVLPRWSYENRPLVAYEDLLSGACDLAGLSESAREKLLTGLPSALTKDERRLVILLRAVLMEPVCVILEEEMWRDLTVRSEESPHARLYRRLLDANSFIVCGYSPAPAGFSLVMLAEPEGGL